MSFILARFLLYFAFQIEIFTRFVNRNLVQNYNKKMTYANLWVKIFRRKRKKQYLRHALTQTSKESAEGYVRIFQPITKYFEKM